MRLFWITFAFSFVHLAAAAGFGNVTVDADGFAPWWVPNPKGRGTLRIMESCATTIFLAAWSSLVLNIPATKQGKATNAKRKALWAIFSFVIPEWVAYIAYWQCRLMRRFLEEMEEARLSLFEKEVDRIPDTVPAYVVALRDILREKFSTRKAYRVTYGWYTTMGGFTLSITDLPPHTRAALKNSNIFSEAGIVTLKPLAIIELAKLGVVLHIKNSRIPHNTLSDTLLKTVSFLQILRFWFTATRRKFAGLPLCLLESYTLVSVGYALPIYSLWWKKPANIETTTDRKVIPLRGLVPVMLFDADTSGDPLFCMSASGKLYAFSQLDTRLSHRHRFCPRCTPEWVPRQITISCEGGKATIYALEKEPRPQREHLSTNSPHNTAGTCLADQLRTFQGHRSIRRLVVAEENVVDSKCPGSHTSADNISDLQHPLSHSPSKREYSDMDKISGPIYSLIEIPSDFLQLTINNFSMFRVFFPGNLKIRLEIEDVDKNIMIGYALILVYASINLAIGLAPSIFPTEVEKNMWIVSCGQMMGWTVAAVLTEVYFTFTAKIRGDRATPFDWKNPNVKIVELSLRKVALPAVLCLFVLAGRLFLMVGAFISLRHAKVEVFYTPAKLFG